MRVVITGMGVVAPNGIGLEAFEDSLRAGRSGVRFSQAMCDAKAQSQVAAIPPGADEAAEARFTPEQLFAMNSGHRFAAIAAYEAFDDAGLTRSDLHGDTVDWDTGAIIGTGCGGVDTLGERVVPMTDSGRVRRLGSAMVEQVMTSGAVARVAGLLGLGNLTTANSSACSTGSEAILMGLWHLRAGRSRRMLCGSVEGVSHYTWAGFDAMKVLAADSNQVPGRASRPLAHDACGFVPGAGGGILVLETLDSALERGARIYAEIRGGAANCGGHRGGGSMTAPNPTGVQRCIRAAIDDAGVDPAAIDAINAHATGTFADPLEIKNWAQALECKPDRLPQVTATKSMIGHLLGAAGSVETIASVLMLHGGFLHPSINCETLHPDIEDYAASINRELTTRDDLDLIIKAGFGFGDVNSCLVLQKWHGN
ncbi:MAG: beta-ketoacyl-[acyl-carrier-protein] synthase family protein [Planctomycetes bacterium]|nr:beta-ketoacyl-[acyl-carrier-protein] synthase family protein [Planctomycetota bacterium]